MIHSIDLNLHKINSTARTENIIFSAWDNNKSGRSVFGCMWMIYWKHFISIMTKYNEDREVCPSIMRFTGRRIYGYILYTEILLVLYIKGIIMNINTNTKGKRKLFLKGFHQLGQIQFSGLVYWSRIELLSLWGYWLRCMRWKVS